MVERRDLLFRFLGDAKSLNKATRGANRDLKSSEKSSKLTGRAMVGAQKAVLGFVAAISAREIGQFAFDAAKMAEAADQAAVSAGKVLGPELDGLNERLKKTRTQLGFNTGEFDSIIARLGLLSESYGLNDKDQARFIESLVVIGGDLAAFNGRVGESEQAIDALTAAIRGEFDPLEQWGVKIKQSEINERKLTLATDPANASLSDQELTILALTELIEERAAPALGSLTDAEDSLAVKTNEATARYEDLKTELGRRLLPVIIAILGQFLKTADAAARLGDDLPNTQLGRFLRFMDTISSRMGRFGGAFDALTRKIDRFKSAIRTAIQARFNITLPKFPDFGGRRFQTGGTVPGPIGSPQPIIAHGGEQITNPRLGQSPGGGAGIVINITAGIADPQAIAREIVDVLQVFNQTEGPIPIAVRSAEQ